MIKKLIKFLIFEVLFVLLSKSTFLCRQVILKGIGVVQE